MSQAGVLNQRGEAAGIGHAQQNLDQPSQPHPEASKEVEAEAKAKETICYTSGCPELDSRVFGGQVNGGLTGGLVGLSSEGDVGIVISLQVAIQHLHRNPTATTRLITTLPVAHVVRLLKGVLKGTLRSSTGSSENNEGDDNRQEKHKLSSESKASILSRILISRVYEHEDLQAVLNELEAGLPFQRLWSTVNRQQEGDREHEPGAGRAGQENTGTGPPAQQPPSIVILTEMDHHFKWMRLQSNGGRLYELYGQLMRRLKALAAIQSSARPPGSTNRPLVFVLNSTLVKRPEEGPARTAAVEDMEDGHGTAPPQTIDQDATYRLALAALQQGRHVGRPAVFRLCCDELARAQCIEPRYKTLLDYYCSLHVCLTRLPVELVDLWGGQQGGSTGPADSSLWVATVEGDELEISQKSTNRTSVAYLSHGIVQDASST